MDRIIILAIVFSLISIFAYWSVFFYFFKRFGISPKNHYSNKPGVSVIVVYKNAEDLIVRTIKTILDQNYPYFEVLAIDDFSTDQGPLQLLEIQDKRLILLNATDNKPGKKSALTEAILHSRYDILLFTDADCTPASGQWIKSMNDTLFSDDKIDIVLGYGPMYRHTGLLNLFLRYETFITAFQYFSYAALKIPYMGVGRNMMYKKSLFLAQEGFTSHEKISSGDDDLFIRNAANSFNTSVNLHPESFVWSEGKSTLRAYLQQKTRHVSTSLYYSHQHKLLLSLFAFSQVLFYLSWIGGIITGVISFNTAMIILLFKWSAQMILQSGAMHKLDVSDLNKWFPLTDFMMLAYFLLLPFYSFFRKKDW